MKSSSGHLVVFEGADGTGKSSLSSAFVTAVRQLGRDAEQHSFPGKVPHTLGELVYRLHHNPKDLGVGAVSATAVQAMHVAAHLDAIDSVLIPALDAGRLIVLDRYWWSTWVYSVVSGVARGVITSLIEAERNAWRGWRPSTVFLVTRKEPLRDEPIEQWNQLQAEYLDLMQLEGEKYPVRILQNDKTPEDALSKALHAQELWS